MKPVWLLILSLFVVAACSGGGDDDGALTYYDLDYLAEQADARFGAVPPVFQDDSDVPAIRAGLAGTIRYYLGTDPASQVPLDPEIAGTAGFGDHVRLAVRYKTESDDAVPAYLLIPVGYPLPRPALLALHQTVSQGKDEPAGVSGDPDMAYGVELARRGYVVLIPDSITAGERVGSGETPFVTAGFDLSHPEWSAMGKMLWDHRRGIDYLQGRPEVDPDRIGVIGHSLGGYNALFLAAFDERIKTVVASCAYTRIETDPEKERWSRTSGFVHFPGLRPYVEPGSTLPLPWDFQHVLALIAPRALFQSFGYDDLLFTNIATVAQIERAVIPGYAAFPGELVTKVYSGGHGFPAEVREAAYEFIGQRLGD